MRKIAIVHPWYPQYRREFFRLLQIKGLGHGIQFDIFCGAPRREMAPRFDSADDPGVTLLRSREIHLDSIRLGYKSLRPVGYGRGYDLVIAEQAVGNLETYWLWLLNKSRFALWGHGGDYVKHPGTVESHVKHWLTRRATWFFAYTPGGVDAVVKAGLSRRRTSAVMNTFDTRSLRRAVETVTDSDLTAFRAEWSIPRTSGHLVGFLGGVDSTKRVDFAIAAVAEARRQGADVYLLVAGEGAHLEALRRTHEFDEWVVFTGRLTGHRKAVFLRLTKLLLNPGRIGLVALDSMVSGVPIITTTYAFHAPEYEYLVAADSAVTTEDNIYAFSHAIVTLTRDEESREAMAARGRSASQRLSVERMADHFIAGCIERLGNPVTW